MATDRQLNKADVEVRMSQILKLVCVGGLTSLLTVGCANMKKEASSAEAATPAASAAEKPAPASVKPSAPAPVVVDAAAEAAAEKAAEQMVASLAKPASEAVLPVMPAKPVAAPTPVVKLEQKPKPTVAPKPLPAPVVNVEPFAAPVVPPEAPPVAKPVPAAVPTPTVTAAPLPVPVTVATEPEVVKKVEPVVAEVATPPAEPVVESKPVEAAPDAGPVSKKLPVRFELWSIDKGKGPYDANAVLITPTFQMGNNRAAGQIYVTVMDDKILVTSSSTIADSKGSSGVRIDDGGWLPFTVITEDNVGIVRGNWLDKLENGSKLTIRLGFFPDMSKSPEQFETDISLADMRSAIPRYKRLLK